MHDCVAWLRSFCICLYIYMHVFVCACGIWYLYSSAWVRVRNLCSFVWKLSMYTCVYILLYVYVQKYLLFVHNFVHRTHLDMHIINMCARARLWATSVMCECMRMYEFLRMYACEFFLCPEIKIQSCLVWFSCTLTFLRTCKYFGHTHTHTDNHMFGETRTHTHTTHVYHYKDALLILFFSTVGSRRFCLLRQQAGTSFLPCVCVYIYIYIYSTHTHIIHIYKHMYTHTCYDNKQVPHSCRVCVCIYIYMYVCMYVYMCVYTYVYTYIYQHIHTHVYTWIYTHTYTHMYLCTYVYISDCLYCHTDACSMFACVCIHIGWMCVCFV